MRRVLLTAVLTLLALLALEGIALGQGYNPWQPRPNAPSVPFPVINPLQGLNTGLTNALAGRQQQVNPTPYDIYRAPIATPPAQLPPGTTVTTP